MYDRLKSARKKLHRESRYEPEGRAHVTARRQKSNVTGRESASYKSELSVTGYELIKFTRIPKPGHDNRIV